MQTTIGGFVLAIIEIRSLSCYSRTTIGYKNMGL